MIGTRNIRSIISVNIGAMFRQTTTVPSVLCSKANIDDTSIAEKRNGTVSPHRSASRHEPTRTVFHESASTPTVNAIWMITSVIGSGSAFTASLLKTDMPADETR